MKKVIAAVLCYVLVLSFVGCGTAHEQAENTPPSNNSQSQQSTKPPASVISQRQEAKTMLNLQSFPILEEEQLRLLEKEQATPTVEDVDIAYSGLIEIDGERYADNPELQVFSDYVAEKFHVVLDKSWKVFVLFYDIDQTVGMVKFQFFIGEEIETNKCITFNLNNGRADNIFYTCLDGAADEDALLERVSSFKEKYEQEQYQLQAGEKFVDQITSYIYYYNTKNLAYCYNIFFSYANGLINNEYGTECFIDKDGNAIQRNYCY